jgi:O-antigen biosynthesis protein WbqV
MVMISTDKAIEPVSMLGLTKRFAEMYCQALDHDLASRPGTKPPMRLISVRFGTCWRRTARWCRSSRLR